MKIYAKFVPEWFCNKCPYASQEHPLEPLLFVDGYSIGFDLLCIIPEKVARSKKLMRKYRKNQKKWEKEQREKAEFMRRYL